MKFVVNLQLSIKFLNLIQAIVLCEYLESQSEVGLLSLKGKRVIELGAGTGLVGMVAATLHGKLFKKKMVKQSIVLVK